MKENLYLLGLSYATACHRSISQRKTFNSSCINLQNTKTNHTMLLVALRSNQDITHIDIRAAVSYCVWLNAWYASVCCFGESGVTYSLVV